MKYGSLLVLLLLLPVVLRPLQGDPLPIDGTSYTHNRYANEIQDQGFLTYDSLTGEPYSFTFYDYVLALFPEPLRVYLPFILGMLTTLYLVLLINKTDWPKRRREYALILTLIAPAFLYTYTRYTPESLALLFFVLGIHAYLNKKYVVAQVLYCFVGLTSPLIAGGGILIYLAQKQPLKKMHYFIPTFLVIGLSWFLHNRFQYLPHDWTFSSVFIELGGMQGYSFFIILLGLIGLVISWKRKDVTRGLAYLLLLSLSLYFAQLRLLTFMVFVGYAAKTIESLHEREWHVPKLKSLTLILIVYTILFSSVLFLNTTVHAPPTGELKQTMTALPPKTGTVFSDPENTPFIHSFMNMPAAQTYKTKNVLTNVSKDIWESQRSTRTLQELSLLQVDYLVITPSRLLQERKGLLFVLDTSGNFSKKYASETLELWEIKR